MASIVLDRISKIFRHRRQEISALKNISLQVNSGELLAVLGPSGSGKTTLLRLIAGLDTPTEGEVCIDGKSVVGVPPHQRDIAMVFQGGALFPHMTVHQNMAFGLKLRKSPAPEIDRRVRDAAEFLGLERCLDRLPTDLSTGQRQRVALGRAMVRQPAILLLDEPLANLDAPMRAEMRAEIIRLQSRIGATTIYVTHDQVEALSLGHRVALFREGSIEQIAEPATLYEQPANLFVARFVGWTPMNLIRGVITASGDSLLFTAVPQGQATPLLQAVLFSLSISSRPKSHLHSYLGRSIILGIRSEDIEIRAADSPDSIDATLNSCERTGPDVFLQVQAAGHNLTLRVPRQLNVLPGGRLRIGIPPAAAHFFDPETGLRLR